MAIIDSALSQALINVVGKKFLITNPEKTSFYRSGFRSGEGEAEGVVFPQSLLQLWRVLELCVAQQKIVIMQAANTGLTEGSSPKGNDYDRGIVIINTTRISSIIVLDRGHRILALAGATLHALERALKPLKRSPHSVIGSSCIGASIVGGVANNSGGALVKRGPAYTELALFAQVNASGKLELVNHLGIAGLGSSPEQILDNLDNHRFEPFVVSRSEGKASDQDYIGRLRNLSADTPARYNADTGRLHEASGCAGKLAVFAVCLDTFPLPQKKQLFYIGNF